MTQINKIQIQKKILSIRLLAKDMLKKMNRSVNPCDNFYQYVCGGDSSVTENNKLLKQVQTDFKTIIENDITNNDPHAFKTLQAYYDVSMKNNGDFYINLNLI